MKTEVIDYIKYHNNNNLIELLKDKRFNPNDHLRGTSFIQASVMYNNFDAFKEIINHSKFDISMVGSNIFIMNILEKYSHSFSEENKRFYDELKNVGKYNNYLIESPKKTISIDSKNSIMYHLEINNDELLQWINHIKFDPNGFLQKKSFIDQAVEFDNFKAFQKIINHEKFNSESLVSKEFINWIIKRINDCDIPENRRYLEEIFKVNYKIPKYFLLLSLRVELFKEIFDNMDKSDVDSISKFSTSLTNWVNFEYAFKYLKQTYNLSQEYVENTFLKQIYENDLSKFLEIIKNENYDITMIDNIPAPEYILSKYFNSEYTIGKTKSNAVQCFVFLVNSNVTYNSDLLENISTKFKNYNGDFYSETVIYNKILTIVNNRDYIKKLFPNFNVKESNILYNIFYLFFMKDDNTNNYNKGKYMDKIIDICIANFNLINSNELKMQIPLKMLTNNFKCYLKKYPINTF